MVVYSLRFDDPGLNSQQDLEQQIFALLARYGLCATVAVIPFHQEGDAVIPLERSAISGLLEAHAKGVIEIAQHGHVHRSRGRNEAGLDTEFAGLSKAEQLDLIRPGKVLLEEVFQGNISGFVPPWNSYDQATLEALIQAGFAYISAGWETPVFDARLVSVPRTCNIWELQDAIVKGQRLAGRCPRIVAVLHHYDFKEVNPAARFSLAQLEHLLGWLSRQANVACKPLATMAEEFAAEPAAWLSFHRWRAKLPWCLRKHIPRELLLKASLPALLRSVNWRTMFWPKRVAG